MGSLPSVFRSIFDKSPDTIMCILLLLGVRSIEDHADDVMHFTHADDKISDKINAELLATLP